MPTSLSGFGVWDHNPLCPCAAPDVVLAKAAAGSDRDSERRSDTVTRRPGDRAAYLRAVPSSQNKSAHDDDDDDDGGSATEITCRPRHFCCRAFLDCCRQAERWTDVSAGREGSVSAVGPVVLGAVVSGPCLNKALSKSLRWRGGRRLTGGPRWVNRRGRLKSVGGA